MNRLILILFIALSMSSCYTTELTYLNSKCKPNTTAINKVPGLSKDLAWDRAIRLFAERNISIKTIDKSSGFIQSNVVSFITAYQIYKDNVPPYPPYIIAQRRMEGGELSHPLYITGSVRIFILNDSVNTEIRVNIEDLKIDNVPSQYNSPTYSGEPRYRALSTGKLESEIADYISSGANTQNSIRIQNGIVRNPNFR